MFFSLPFYAIRYIMKAIEYVANLPKGSGAKLKGLPDLHNRSNASQLHLQAAG